MLCKFCNAEIEDDRLYCPVCGKRQDVEINKEEQTQKPAQKGDWKLIAGVAAVLAVACLLAVVFMMGRKDNAGPGQGTAATTTTPESTAPESEYSQHAGVVVAKLMDTELTNDMLQMFYMTMVNSFLEDYSTSLNYLGIDLAKPLGEQAYPYNQEGETTIETWEDFFLDLALERWKNCVGTCAIAEQSGFQLDEEWLKLIDEQMASLEKVAKENNYESADAMVKTFYGDCCSVETYKTFLTMDTTAEAYYYTLLEVTDAQIEECFLENEATLKKEGITKTSGFVSDVRHILIAPEGGTKSEDGKTTVYSDAEWEACKQKAEQVLQEWKENATEENFSALVKKYTADTASASTGGLYEGITKDSSYVPEFRAWAVDASRKEGDTGLVKTSFGYHIMYYVGGEAEWIYYGRGLQQEKNLAAMEEQLKKLLEENPAEIFQDLIVMQNTYAR